MAVRENDELAAYRVIEAKQEVVDATNGLAAVEGIDLTTPTGLLQMRSVLSASQLLRLLYSITRRAAKTVLPPEVGGGTG